MKFKWYRLREDECCPFCKEKCIKFHTILRSLELWAPYRIRESRIPKCPNCGAIIFADHAARGLGILAVVIVIAALIALIKFTGKAYVALWEFLAVISVLLADTLLAVSCDLDYEGTWKYPKPENDDEPQNDDDGEVV